jgi:transcription elongation factor Elf1
MQPSQLALRYLANIQWVAPKGDFNARLDLGKLGIQCDDLSKNIHHFVYDGNVIRRKNTYFMSFECLTCSRENILALNNVVSKIDRNIAHCSTCNGKVEICTETDKVAAPQIRSKIEKDTDDFQLMDEGFKARYTKKLMTPVAFETIRKSIVGYQYMKFTNIADVVYVPFYRCGESPKSYEPMFYDSSRDTIEKPTHVTFQCDHCAYQFTVKDIMPYRNKKRIMCKACEVEFGPTKPKYEDNINGEKVVHRTMFQHKFIKYCNKHSIVCQQGPQNIEFKHVDGTLRSTNVHFYLPECDVWIDVFGNLEYQKEASEKTKALIEHANANGKRYVMLYPKNYVKLTRGWKKIVDRKNNAVEN